MNHNIRMGPAPPAPVMMGARGYPPQQGYPTSAHMTYNNFLEEGDFPALGGSKRR